MNKAITQTETCPPADTIEFHAAVAEGKEILKDIEKAERGQLRLGELVGKLEPKYDFAKALGMPSRTLAGYYDIYRASLTRWRPFPIAVLKELKIFPNELWISSDGKVGALAALKHERWGDYNLSQAGLVYLEDAVKKNRIERGVVIWARSYNGGITAVAEKPLDEVLATLEHASPEIDQYKRKYYRMNTDFTLQHVQGNLF
jgi:hypothetical protein